MAESDDLALDDFEDDEDDAAEDADGGQKNPLRSVVKKLERKLKHLETKVIPERETQAIENFKRQQAKQSQASEVLGQFGFAGMAQTYLQLHPDVDEVQPGQVKEWLEAQGLPLQEQDQPEPAGPPAPAPVANFHRAGTGTAPQAQVFTGPELQDAFRRGEINNEEIQRVISEGRLKRG